MLNRFDIISTKITRYVGSSTSFWISVVIILLWAASGPLMNYNDTWQLIINTSTTIVTFLLVILVQRSANREMLALHVKLNELIAASKANNFILNIEDLSENELVELRKYYSDLRLRSISQASSQLPPQIDDNTPPGVSPNVQ
jgi:low affinity Fe/Cu permease